MQSLLPDEAMFLGVSWTTLRTTEAYLLTTESRLTGGASSSGAENWFLSATASRFSRPGVLVSETVAIGVRGTGSSQKLVRFEQGISTEQHAEPLGQSSVLELFAIPKSDAVIVVYVDGACEVRSALSSLPLVSNRLGALVTTLPESTKASKRKSSKVNETPITSTGKVITVQFLTSRSCLVLVTSSGDVAFVRIVNKAEQGDDANSMYTLEKEIVTLPAALRQLLNAVVHSYRPDACALSLVTCEGRLCTLAVSYGNLKVEELLTDGRLVLEGSEVLEGTVGCRLLRYNSGQKRLEAWDFVHGVLINTWPLEVVGGVSFIRASPSGRTVMIGNDKAIHTVQMSCTDEPTSLARVFAALKKFPPLKDSQEDSQPSSKTSSKSKKKRGDLETAIDEERKRPKSTLDAIDAVISEAFSERSYDLLNQMLEAKTLTSIRNFGNCLMTAIEDGRVDFVTTALLQCADISPSQIVSLVKVLLGIAAKGKNHENKAAVKALTSFGGTLDKGVSLVITQALTSPNLIEKELVHALTMELRHAEEVAAVIASLMYVAESSETRDNFIKALLSSAVALDARPMVKIPSGTVPVFESLRKTIQRELVLCERSEQAIHRMHLLLHDPTAYKQQQQRSAGEYRTEKVML